MNKSKLIFWISITISSLILTSCLWNYWKKEISESNQAHVKDWSYSVRQKYIAWDNWEYNFYIDVNLDIKNKTISKIEVIWDPDGKWSVWYAEEFKKSIKEKVIWKSIDQAKEWWYLSWSSLTSKAFSDALDTIKTQSIK